MSLFNGSADDGQRFLRAFESLAKSAAGAVETYSRYVDAYKSNIDVVINIEANAQRLVMEDRLNSAIDAVKKLRRPQDV